MTDKKIKTLSKLKKIVSLLKAKGKIIVFTNGCFDILHYGHLKYLEDAKKLGDALIVAVNSDSSVKKIKGTSRPINKEKDRVLLVAGLKCVDYCLIFNELTPYNLIKQLRPDILVKGGDWSKKEIIGADFVKSYKGKVKTIKFLKGYSTTGLLRRIQKIEE